MVAIMASTSQILALTKSGVYLIGVESSGSPVQMQLQHNPILVLSSYPSCFKLSKNFKVFFKNMILILLYGRIMSP